MDINKAIKSEIHHKIIRFFSENQASVDTPRGIATWIGEERERVKSALEDLVSMKILIALRSPSTTGYGFTRDEKLISKIASLLKKSEKSNY